MLIANSYGGGVQSVAIAVLIREGALPRPDLMAICDTGRERATTFQYLRQFLQPYLDAIGLTVQVISHDLARVDMYAKDGLTLIPAYTSEGRLSAYCSGEWKRDVFERWLRQQGVKECESWIGFSLDEQRRMKGDHRDWCHLRFPLIEKRITREMCKRIIEGAGLPIPSKSRCWMCPHQTDDEWQDVKDDVEDWEKAVALEKEINDNDPEQKGLYLWSGRKSLEMADFTRGQGQLLPMKPCEGSNCWT